jgi:hypothetical protein
MKIRKLNAATALGSLTASVALLAGMQGAHAQGAPGAGSFPGSFLVPGTQTSFKVGGYIKLDYTYDFGAMQVINGGASPFGNAFDSKFRCLGSDCDTGDTENILADSGHRIHGVSQMTASESRFNIETRTPTAYGELKTFIEGDFTNPNGLTNTGSLKVNSDSYGFRLRQAYGTLGPFLAGQTLSLFRDGAAEAETLDFGGAQATGVTRQPQVRYTFDFGNGLTWAAAAENPQTQRFNLGSDSTSTTFGSSPKQGDKIPDFTTALVYNAPWGHLNLHVVFRDLYWHDGVCNSPCFNHYNSSTFGWAVGFSGNWNVPIGKDSVAWEAAYGQGGGRYVNSDGPPTPDVFTWDGCATTGCTVPSTNLHAIPSWLLAANYTHFWTDTLRSNIAGSYWMQENKWATSAPRANSSHSSQNADNLYKDTWTGHVNLIWSPVPQTNFGVEYMYMGAKLENGRKGNFSRLQLSAQFKF